LIRLDRVSLSIGQSRILRDIDLTLRDGEWIALTGRNGSGKSMLLRLMAGLVEPSSGRLTVDGRHPLGDAAGGGPHGSGNAGAPFDLPGSTQGGPESAGGLPVGIAFQNPDSQFVTTSVAREVRFGMENLGLEAAEIESRFREAIERFVLEALLDRNPHMLSGGEKQRLLLACIWSMSPRHILLDEPFSFLDEEARRSALETVRRTFHDEGRTVVWATLDPEELSLADRVICIDGGHIVYDGPVTGAETALPEGVLVSDMPSSRVAEGPAGGNTILEMNRVVLSPIRSNFTLTVPQLSLCTGETLGVTGPSGSGKTTLLLGCSGLLPPRKGDVILFGESIRSRKDFPAGRIAFLFQSPEEGFFAPTVGEEVALANRRFGAGRSDGEVAREALERVGLDPDLFMERNPYHLSQGEKRLIALASQLALPARLFLMDEPTLFLDGMARARLAEALDRLAASGATIVIASHDTRFVQSRSERQVRLPFARPGC
jgi:energy-coupling factor transporter ATP-binding protein EcfA2